MAGNKLRCLKRPLKSVKRLSHTGNNIEIRHFGIWNLLCYISDPRVLGRETSKCLVQMPISSSGAMKINYQWPAPSQYSSLLTSEVQLWGLNFFHLTPCTPLSFTCPIPSYPVLTLGSLSAVCHKHGNPMGLEKKSHSSNPGQEHSNHMFPTLTSHTLTQLPISFLLGIFSFR